MKDETLSTFQDFLYELRGPAIEFINGRSPLMEMIEREAAERKAIDDAYLASLTDDERRRVLIQRRIAALEARYCNWWEANMAWRFRPDPPDYGDDDW